MLSIYLLWLISAVFAKWTVSDGTISVRGGEKLSFDEAITSRIALGTSGTLDVSFKTKHDGKAELSHQSMVQLRSQDDHSLNFMYAPSSAKPMTGLVKVAVSHASVPVALQGLYLDMVLLVGSANDDTPLEQKLTSIFVEPTNPDEAELQPGPKPEIHHIFRGAPRTVSKFTAMVFQSAVVGITAIALLTWVSIATPGSLGTAFASAPIAHLAFLGSVFGLEATFVRYFVGQSIFTTLFHGAILAPICIVSGSRALREMASRRMSGESK